LPRRGAAADPAPGSAGAAGGLRVDGAGGGGHRGGRGRRAGGAGAGGGRRRVGARACGDGHGPGGGGDPRPPDPAGPRLRRGPGGPDGLRAVIDWELVHVGDPVEDLAWACVKAWRFGAAPEAAGVGTIDELLAAYEAAGGAAVERATFDWWLVEKTLQWGILCMK